MYKTYEEHSEYGRDICNFTVGEVFRMTGHVETTGYRGGDAGHGGKTIIKLYNQEPGYNDGNLEFEANDIGVRLCFKGDWEMESLIASLELIVNFLKENQK